MIFIQCCFKNNCKHYKIYIRKYEVHKKRLNQTIDYNIQRNKWYKHLTIGNPLTPTIKTHIRINTFRQKRQVSKRYYKKTVHENHLHVEIDIAENKVSTVF